MPSRFNPVKIFSGNATRDLADRIAKSFGQPLGRTTLSTFSDGELQPSFDETVRGCDVFIVQSTIPPAENLMELLLMIDAAKRASAHYITAVIPYYGYARQDRKDKPRVSIASKMVADLISSAGAGRIMTMDLHAPQIQGFFNIPVDHLDSSVIFVPHIAKRKSDDLIIASPDIGGSKRARQFAQDLDVGMVICDKHRKKANQVSEMNIIGSVEGKDVVMVDDMIDTGGTLAKAANLMIEQGAKSVSAYCTHPVLSKNAYDNIENSALDALYVCDTIPIHQEKTSKIKVLSSADLFAQAIRNVYEYGSISSLFDLNNEV